MTNIEKIKQARQELTDALNEIEGHLPDASRELLITAIDRLSYLQAEAIRQATEVADENFARAQKLSEQVQENVRHIERLAGERGEVFTALVDALSGMIKCFDDGVGVEWNEKELAAARAALALAKGEAV